MNITKLTPNSWQTENIADWAAAMAKYHADAPKPKKGGVAEKGTARERWYVRLDDILDVAQPALAKQGLFVSQDVSGDTIITSVIHLSGQFRASSMNLTAAQIRGTSDIQKMGGGITYAKRYALSAALGISADEDDDGSNSPVSISVEDTEAIKQQGRKVAMWDFVKGVEDLDALNTLWSTFPTLHGDPSFKGAVKARKAQLAG